MHRTDDPADITVFNTPADLQKPAPTRRASLVVLAGGEIGQEIPLSAQEQIFGRSNLANSQIDAPSVSRKHACIALVERDGETFYEITDLGSRNGTRVNDVPILSSRLNHGDRIHMGEVAFRFVLQDTHDAEFHQNIHRLIHYDQLTGLLAMETFWRRLGVAIRRSPDHPFTLAMTDLDGLKRVNDTFGHLAGRMVVGEMGAMIRSTLRPRDHAGLYGGDETILLFTETPLEQAHEIAEKIRATVAARVFDLDGRTFQVTISQGLAEWPRHGATADELVAAADAALYAAKNSGRNCVRCAGE